MLTLRSLNLGPVGCILSREGAYSSPEPGHWYFYTDGNLGFYAWSMYQVPVRWHQWSGGREALQSQPTRSPDPP